MMGNLVRSKTIWTGLALSAGYWIVAAFVPADDMVEVLNWLLVTVALVVTMAYLPTALASVAAGRVDRVHNLVLGIVCAWASTAVMRGWVGIWRYLDEPPWMQASYVLGFMLFGGILGGALHITAPNATTGQIPRRNWLMLAAALLLGGIVSGFFLGARFGGEILN